MKSYSDVCVLVVFYNGNNDVYEHIKEFSRNTDSVCLIDNKSTLVESLQVLEKIKELDGVDIISNTDNYGIAYALNQGLEFAHIRKKKYMLTMDQDSYIDTNSIINLVEYLEKHNDVASVGPYYGMTKKYDMYDTKRVDYLITSGNLVRVQAALQIGGYNSDLFIDSVDFDFSFHLGCEGYTLVKLGTAFMKHKIGEYEASRLLKIRYKAHSPNRYYYIYRNNIYIYRRYRNYYPKQCLKLFLSLIKNTGQLMFLERDKMKKISNAVKGIKDGISMR